MRSAVVPHVLGALENIEMSLKNFLPSIYVVPVALHVLTALKKKNNLKLARDSFPSYLEDPERKWSQEISGCDQTSCRPEGEARGLWEKK